MLQMLVESLGALLIGAACLLWGYRVFLLLLIGGFFADVWLDAHGSELMAAISWFWSIAWVARLGIVYQVRSNRVYRWPIEYSVESWI